MASSVGKSLAPDGANSALVPAARWDQKSRNEYAYLSCADGIAFGCLAVLLGARVQTAPPISRALTALGIACVLLIVVFRGVAADLGIPGREYGVTVLELGVALILFSTTQRAGSPVELPWTALIQTVGRGSYEIYLTHMLVVLGLIPIVVELKPDASIPLWYLGLLALSIGLGLIVQKTYSEPLNRLLRSRRAVRPLPDKTIA